MNVEIKKLNKKEDERGWLIEFLKGNNISTGQFFITLAYPGKTKGNHYHKRKIEWFFVIKGEAILYLKDNKTKEIREIMLCETNPLAIKINPNITHKITNIGKDDMYLLVYSNEVFNKKNPDTFLEG